MATMRSGQKTVSQMLLLNLSTIVRNSYMHKLWVLQRRVVYISWLTNIAPSYMSPYGGGGSCGVSANEYST
jgi:hypothetical protein